MKRTTMWAVTALALQGCATPVMTEREATSHADLSPKEFIKKRFYDTEQSQLQDQMTRFGKALVAIDKAIGAPGGGKLREDPRRLNAIVSADGSVVNWTAYYTDMNFVQLVRPVAELRRFCLAKGGRLLNVDNHTRDMLADLRRSPVDAYLSGHARVHRMLAARGAYVGVEEQREAVAQIVASEMALEAGANNRAVDRAYAAKALTYAQRLDAFGVFQCDSKDPTTSWYFSVLPIFLEPADKNNALISAVARLSIKVYEGPAKR